MFVLTREERKVYESGHWHDHDPKGSPAFSTVISSGLSPVQNVTPLIASVKKPRRKRSA